jgi:chloride channel 3/4/5
MPQDEEQATERTKLLYNAANDRRLSAVQQETEAQSLIGTHVSKDELALHSSPVGERLPYNDYTTIDWLHDLVRQPLSHIEP